ncbi:MAG: hypothetical protein QOE96_603 [Blastocatellia bacterium]|jgi:hypothetical protein|nr:hypothetical protein [Blastocatellia bacterium]
MYKLLKKCLNSPFLWPAIALVIAINLWLGIKAGGDNLLEIPPAARWGIVSLEMAGTVDKAKAILQVWARKSPEGIPLRTIALHSLIYDCGFLVLYTATLAMACLISATLIDTRHPKLARMGLAKLGRGLAHLQGVVAALDTVENIALWRILRSSGLYVWPALAKACAVPKFALIAITFTYILVVFVVRLGEIKQRIRQNTVAAT